MADLPDTLTDTHDHTSLFQLVQGTFAGLGASGKRRRQFHDRETDKQNPVAVLDSICQDFIQQAGIHDLCRAADREPERCPWKRHTGRQGCPGYHKFIIHQAVSSFLLVWIDNGGSG